MVRTRIRSRCGRDQGPSNRGRGNCRNNPGNNSIADKYLFGGEMKDGPILKLIITKTGHQPTQYKKIVDTLPVLCADKNYQRCNLDQKRSSWKGLHTALLVCQPIVYHSPCGNYNRQPDGPSSSRWLVSPHLWNPGANTSIWHKSPEGVSIGIKMGFQEQVFRVLQISYWQERLDLDHIGTMWQSKKEQNCSWSNLRSRLPSRKTHQIPQETTYCLF